MGAGVSVAAAAAAAATAVPVGVIGCVLTVVGCMAAQVLMLEGRHTARQPAKRMWMGSGRSLFLAFQVYVHVAGVVRCR